MVKHLAQEHKCCVTDRQGLEPTFGKLQSLSPLLDRPAMKPLNLKDLCMYQSSTLVFIESKGFGNFVQLRHDLGPIS